MGGKEKVSDGGRDVGCVVMNVMCCWVKAVRERLREWRSAVLAEMGSEGMLVGMLR